MKNLLVITSEFPPLPGGIGTHAFQLSKSLCEKNYKVTVITDQRSPKISEDLAFDQEQSFKIYRTKRKKINLFTYLSRFIKGFQNIRKNEIIICSGKFSLWLGAVLKLFFHKKNYVAVVHGTELNLPGKYEKKLTSYSLNHYKKIIAVSKYTKNLVLKNKPYLKVEVINNGFIPAPFTIKHQLKKSNFPVLTTVGHVKQRKGQQNVINALPDLIKTYPQLVYNMVGIPTEKEQLLILAKKLKVDNHVIFHGAVSEEEKLNILQQTDIFMMLSNKLANGDVEGFGIAILEANDLKIPAIGSMSSGITDAISNNYSGKLVNPQNVSQICEAVDVILNNYQTYSTQAKMWSENFHWNKIVKQYLKVINQ